ncbi:DUF3102 domain-containing protein [Agathobaculum sp. Marseille-P7918]|uniref:DUF3102 domain-containing protein n=1 Tax=Agathobaculum sp. Marseille-P7918 TaxID=2479843 RepID=UPI003569700C
MSDKVVAVRSIDIVTAEIYTIRDNAARVFMDSVVQIGRRLEEAKQLVPHGEWTDYLDTKLGYKPSTAQNYMRIAREFGDGQVGLSGKTASDFFGNLGYSQLLPLLGLPEEEREQLAEEHDLAGMSSREIAALVKERDEAKAAAAAAQEQADKQGQEARSARSALATAKDKLKVQTQKAQEQAEAAKANAETAAELQRRLDELAAQANQPRDLTDEERAALRAEVVAEQSKALQAAEDRAAEALAKLEKFKNPAAHKVNFLFGELCEYWRRLQAALKELEQSDEEAAGKMKAAIGQVIGGWNL